MSILKGNIQMTGSAGGYSFYTRRGSDKVIMRTKGGATKNQIANSPKFAKSRKNQKEFGGSAKFGSKSRHAFGGLHRLADYNLTPVLIGMGKNLMKFDLISDVGQRKIILSEHKQVLEEFSFNRNYAFNTVLRVIPRWEIDREELQAVVTIPVINTALYLLNIQKLPYFRLIVVIGSISDMIYNPKRDCYEPMVLEMHGVSQAVTGAWNSTQTVLAEHTMTVQLPASRKEFLNDNVSVLLSMGIEFGTAGFTGETVEVKYAGCGKVIAVR